MGMDANIVCVGKFNKELIHCMAYDEESYENVAEGAIVITTLCNCNTTAQSQELARVLGIDPWDFNTHGLIAGRINWKELEELSEECAEWDKTDIDDLRLLLQHKFLCIYQPNG